MKLSSKLFAALALGAVLASCDKKDSTDPLAGNGTAPRLESNTLNFAPVATDSLRSSISLRWSTPNYAANMPTKYTIQIDSVGKNFSNPFTRVVTDANNADILNKDLVNWMLITRDWNPNTATTLEARVVSSYSNNNEPLASNTIQLSAKAYQPALALPVPGSNNLWITGGDFGWNNTAVMPNQKLTQVNPYKFTGTFQINGGNSFLLLPVAGDWGDKYGGMGSNNNSNNPIHDLIKRGGSDLRAPLGAGTYRLDVNFLTGMFNWTKLS